AFFVLAIASLQSVSPTSHLAAMLTGSTILACSSAFFQTPTIAVSTAFGPEAIMAHFAGTALVRRSSALEHVSLLAFRAPKGPPRNNRA
ncbi:hypothetical protein FRC12_015848, partial [Ceratobasidium sp. 428]